MDTTVSSVKSVVDPTPHPSRYVSCIIFDGTPILPPLMSEEKRIEMRRYRQLAIQKEEALKVSRTLRKMKEHLMSHSGDNSMQQTALGNPGKANIRSSTPQSDTHRSDSVILSSGAAVDGRISSSSSISFVNQENEDADIDENDVHSDSNGNLASAASSTGTFIIKTHSQGEGDTIRNKDDHDSSTDYEDFSDEQEAEDNVPKTVLRCPAEQVSSGTKDEERGEGFFNIRKRRARFFDDDETSASHAATDNTWKSGSTPSTSLSKYIAEKSPGFTPLLEYNLPNSVTSPHNNDDTKCSNSDQDIPTFVMNVDFANLSSRAIRKGVRRGSNSPTEKPTPGSTSLNPERMTALSERLSNKSAGHNLEFDSENSESSDKENCNNQDKKPKHVRKLSYTLSAPSSALLSASAKNESVDKNSNSSSPQEKDKTFSTVTSEDVKARFDKVEDTLLQLQELNLGKGKLEHLHRYLDESKTHDKNGILHQVLEKMELEQQKQMETLSESYKSEALKLKEDFEKQKLQILNELNECRTRYMLCTGNNSEDLSVLSDVSNVRSTATSTSVSPRKTDVSGVSTAMSPSFYALKKGTPVASFAGSDNISLGDGNLYKFQSKMQKFNPKLLRNFTDVKSPLLKGIIIPPPLVKPKVPKIPMMADDPKMKPKFDRLSALVKGYLTRRLLRCEKIQMIVQTIRDTVELLLKLYEENSPNQNQLIIKAQDEGLHRRLLQQLTGACSSFHDIFFQITTKERMAIISNDRDKLKAKALKFVLNGKNSVPSPKRNISMATIKSIERRLTLSKSPKKYDNRNSALSSHQSNCISTRNIQSVKAKPVKSFNVSPKRRRISFWGDIPRSDNVGGRNRVSTSHVTGRSGFINPTGKPALGTRTSFSTGVRNSGQMSMETFVIPNPPNVDKRKSRPSTSVSQTKRHSVTTTQKRPSTATNNSKVPWK